MLTAIQKMGHAVLEACVLSFGLLRGCRGRLIIQQMYHFGVESLPIVFLSSIFTGSILTYQSYYALVQFGSIEMMGQLVAMSIHRELGPVMCALLLSGRAASSCTAELMLMRETDQMDALKVLGADLHQWVIYPRILGYWLSSILLSIVFNGVALATSGLLAVSKFSLDWSGYWSRMAQAIFLDPDLFMWMRKVVLFGWVVSIVMVRQGMYVQPSNEGIAHAVTRTVVISSTLVLFFDMMITSLSL